MCMARNTKSSELTVLGVLKSGMNSLWHSGGQGESRPERTWWRHMHIQAGSAVCHGSRVPLGRNDARRGAVTSIRVTGWLVKWRFTPLCLRIMREFIKNMNPWALPSPTLPMTQMCGSGQATPRPGNVQTWGRWLEVRQESYLWRDLKGQEGSGCYPGNQETIPWVLKRRSEVVEQYSRKSREEE